MVQARIDAYNFNMKESSEDEMVVDAQEQMRRCTGAPLVPHFGRKRCPGVMCVAEFDAECLALDAISMMADLADAMGAPPADRAPILSLSSANAPLPRDEIERLVMSLHRLCKAVGHPRSNKQKAIAQIRSSYYRLKRYDSTTLNSGRRSLARAQSRALALSQGAFLPMPLIAALMLLLINLLASA